MLTQSERINSESELILLPSFGFSGAGKWLKTQKKKHTFLREGEKKGEEIRKRSLNLHAYLIAVFTSLSNSGFCRSSPGISDFFF